jgi:hypothetical protein
VRIQRDKPESRDGVEGVVGSHDGKIAKLDSTILEKSM